MKENTVRLIKRKGGWEVRSATRDHYDGTIWTVSYAFNRKEDAMILRDSIKETLQKVSN